MTKPLRDCLREVHANWESLCDYLLELAPERNTENFHRWRRAMRHDHTLTRAWGYKYVFPTYQMDYYVRDEGEFNATELLDKDLSFLLVGRRICFEDHVTTLCPAHESYEGA